MSKQADRIVVEKKHTALERSLPWLAGAGMALAHIGVSSSCTLPGQGRCSTCGSCVVALAGLVTWAIYRKRQTASTCQSADG